MPWVDQWFFLAGIRRVGPDEVEAIVQRDVRVARRPGRPCRRMRNAQVCKKRHLTADAGVTLGGMAGLKNDAAVCPNHSNPPDGQPLARGPAPGFVALSRFVVANGMAPDVKTAFRNRPHLVEGASGYLRMDVISPVERPEELWLITVWTDEASFTAWHHSHLYRGAHAGIPKGLKLMPGETELRRFEHVAC